MYGPCCTRYATARTATQATMILPDGVQLLLTQLEDSKAQETDM